jgi:hypothetical protein
LAMSICWSLSARSARGAYARPPLAPPGRLIELAVPVVPVAGVSRPVTAALTSRDLVPVHSPPAPVHGDRPHGFSMGRWHERGEHGQRAQGEQEFQGLAQQREGQQHGHCTPSTTGTRAPKRRTLSPRHQADDTTTVPRPDAAHHSLAKLEPRGVGAPGPASEPHTSELPQARFLALPPLPIVQVPKQRRGPP